MLSREQRIGLFFVVAVVLFFVAVELTLGLRLLGKRYTLYAVFHDVQGLDVGADVRLAGLRAGRVSGMQIEGDHVRVSLSIDRDLAVKRDAVARLDFRALSGERFVALTLGSPGAPAAAPGDTIEGETPSSFADAMDQLTTVGQAISDLAENLDRNSGRLLNTLADVVEENRTALADITQRVASITDKLDHGTGTLGLLLNDPTLYDRVTATMGDVRQSVQDLGKVTADLSQGRSTLGKLLTDDQGLYGQVRDTVDQLNAAAHSAAEITQALQDGQGTVGKALTDDALYDQSLDTLRTAERATQSVEDQAPLSILGTIATSLF
ncbi:MAG TPA: MlaD family protein [Candidatus Binatia bacterium]|nr:MlaD family protein [Candidatus Binatia bacterium]